MGRSRTRWMGASWGFDIRTCLFCSCNTSKYLSAHSGRLLTGCTLSLKCQKQNGRALHYRVGSSFPIKFRRGMGVRTRFRPSPWRHRTYRVKKQICHCHEKHGVSRRRPRYLGRYLPNQLRRSDLKRWTQPRI